MIIIKRAHEIITRHAKGNFRVLLIPQTRFPSVLSGQLDNKLNPLEIFRERFRTKFCSKCVL